MTAMPPFIQVPTEVCDGIDNDCDSDIDDADSDLDLSTTTSFYDDNDSDGYGDSSTLTNACTQPSGTVTDNTDCDDTDATINPAATEVCDASDTDENCNGLADNNDPSTDASGFTTYYEDTDADTYGSSVTFDTCDLPTGYSSVTGDCDDANALINPAATEVCDAGNVDEDCNGVADDDDAGTLSTSKTTYYDDADNDGYGDPSSSADFCDQPSGTVTDDQDCDDSNGLINPGQAELALDGLDNDCDLQLPEWDGDFDVDVDAHAELYGLSANAYAGSKVQIVSDVNSDGYDDLVVGSYGDGSSTSNAGAAFVNWGPVTGTQSLGTSSAVILGSTTNGNFGVDLNYTQDVNGDGVVDLLVAEQAYNNYSGGVYVFEGPVSGSLTTSDADSIIEGSSLFTYADRFDVGDVDGDGVSDVIIAAELADNGSSNTGSAYVVSGPVTSSVNVANSGSTWSGAASNDRLGKDVSYVGDVDSDGYGDFLVSSGNESTAATNGGAVYLLLGSVTGSNVVSSAWMTTYGEADGGQLSLALLSDVTGDGNDDLIYASGLTDHNGSNSGSVYVQSGPLSSGTYLADTDFIRLDGELAGDEFGSSLSVTGDVNGDGFAEITVGSVGQSAAYIIDGTTLTSGTVSSGLYLQGLGGSSLGASLSTSGDVDGDGFSDILLGDPAQNSSSGSAFLVFGEEQ